MATSRGISDGSLLDQCSASWYPSVVSTKNLARTVIEGGRTSGYKIDVRDAKRSERASERSYLRAVQKDGDAADALPTPARTHVGKSFADKLNPIYQFLDSRIGKSWAKVRAEMFARFDTRTTPGRHIVFDHILGTVAETGGVLDRFRYIRYVVDKQGRLQKNKERTRYARYRPLEAVDWDAITEWLGNRQITPCGERFAWMIPTRDAAVRASMGKLNSWPYNLGKIQYVFVDKGRPILEEVPCPWPPGDIRRALWSKRFVEKVSTTTRWRQAHLLDKTEEAFFLSLPQHARDRVLEASSRERAGKVFR